MDRGTDRQTNGRTHPFTESWLTTKNVTKLNLVASYSLTMKNGKFGAITLYYFNSLLKIFVLIMYVKALPSLRPTF